MELSWKTHLTLDSVSCLTIDFLDGDSLSESHVSQHKLPQLTDKKHQGFSHDGTKGEGKREKKLRKDKQKK